MPKQFGVKDRLDSGGEIGLVFWVAVMSGLQVSPQVCARHLMGLNLG
jgi:hypothetical protein